MKQKIDYRDTPGPFPVSSDRWFDRREAVPFPMRDSVLYLTRKGNWVLKSKDNFWSSSPVKAYNMLVEYHSNEDVSSVKDYSFFSKLSSPMKDTFTKLWDISYSPEKEY